ncbi:Y-family DNA polymerase [Deinococcus yavapaiensis]|uniref:Protein ImuB n=1 Tax=Deinococcus yavapaiensis KR-236 TaxID=694435 RepID=A0A318SA86_9DEIO|nr:Y-family DNA polymerase [Deinococcus yavapaiensis]PYE56320.1 protein ImuB [Deinococcus yavapaiensis KR-236]
MNSTFGTSRTFVVCVRLEPFALWHARRSLGFAGPPVVVTRGGRVAHASDAATSLGVRVGMPLHAATSGAPELAHEEEAPPLLAGAWEALLQDLFAYSPKVEPLGEGRALLTVTLGAARELAAFLHARVGAAPSRESALLAAACAAEGTCVTVQRSGEDDFLRCVPVDALRVVGLSEANARRLRLLGVSSAFELARWSKAQLAAFLGEDARFLRPFLFGPRGDVVRSFRSAPRVEVGFDFEEPVTEPGAWEEVLSLLAGEALQELRGRLAARLSVRVRTEGGWLEGVRTAKEPLRDAGRIARLAFLALESARVGGLGVDRVELHLGGLARAARQGGLWEREAPVAATDAVLARFPDALVRARVLDEDAFSSDARFEWLGWRDGERRGRRVPGAARPLRGPRPPEPDTAEPTFRLGANYADGGSA